MSTSLTIAIVSGSCMPHANDIVMLLWLDGGAGNGMGAG
jgi:hypothetical protein